MTDNPYETDPQPGPGPADESFPPPEEEKRQSAGRQIVELLGTLLVAFLIAQVVRTWVIQPFVIPTGSMIPTIQLQDQVLVNKFIYRFESPKRGDIVVVDDPTGEVPILIKRVVAVGGQTVDLRDGRVVIDGTPIDEPYTHGLPSAPLPGSPVSFPVRIPQGSVWLMGDNRPQSKDSRFFGPVALSAVHGRAFLTYWPVSRIGGLE